MSTELHCETTKGMKGTVTLYECEHITAGVYKIASSADNLLSTGENTAVLLCVHCVTHLRGQVLGEMVMGALREKPVGELMPILSQEVQHAE